jgi:hypothetical protein
VFDSMDINEETDDHELELKTKACPTYTSPATPSPLAATAAGTLIRVPAL